MKMKNYLLMYICAVLTMLQGANILTAELRYGNCGSKHIQPSMVLLLPGDGLAKDEMTLLSPVNH